jgi:cyclopropane-fatty-acyl-phospholipid synthase
MMQKDELASEARGGHLERWRYPFLRLADRFLLDSLSRALANDGVGRLHLSLPSGEVAVLGNTGGACEAYLCIKTYRALWRTTRGGSLGFAECFMDGDVTTDNLKSVFEFYVANESILTQSFPSLLHTTKHDRSFHARRTNTLEGSRENIASHYDLGNDFYRLWLDSSMAYSSGIFEGADTLEDAQARKIAHVLAALDLEPGMSLLEIGCGWGNMAEAAGRLGAYVDAITISQKQHKATMLRISAAGLASRVSCRLEDYRATTGAFDRVVSVEMIEAVGEENWQSYFDIVAERLKPGGVGVIQAITINDRDFERYRQNPDFIQRHIFPGGVLPTVDHMRRASQKAGLTFDIVDQFGQSYKRTLAEWRSRFEFAWPRIQALGFDERFRRMWLYYLTYCETGFEHGSINVGTYRLRKLRHVRSSSRSS